MHNHNHIIRDFNLEDSKQITRLFNEFGRYLRDLDTTDLNLILSPANYGDISLAGLLQNIKEKDGKILVVEIAEKIVGFISGVVLHVGFKPDEMDCKPHLMGRVTTLFISKDFRGLGLGLELIEKIETFFREQKCYKVNIEVFGPNNNALNFYEKHKYRVRNYDLVKLL